MTAGLLEKMRAESPADDGDGEFTWRVVGQVHPADLLSMTKGPLMKCPVCQRKLWAHMDFGLGDAWFHTASRTDVHQRLGDAGLDFILAGGR